MLTRGNLFTTYIYNLQAGRYEALRGFEPVSTQYKKKPIVGSETGYIQMFLSHMRTYTHIRLRIFGLRLLVR